MQQVNLGNTGIKVSRLCLGTMTYGTSKWRNWVLDERDAIPFYKRALDLGITFFDTADVYSQGESEVVTGRALKQIGAQRENVVVATKVFNPMGDGPNQRGLSRKHIMHAIDASLRRLDLDYVDLYQIHRFDGTTPVEETMEALTDVVKAGKALHIGASSMFAWQFAKMQQAATQNGFSRFVTMQNHYNLIYREEEREMIPLCVDQGVGIIPWSPLARGFLAGNRRRQDFGETSRSKGDEMAQRMYYQDSDFRVVDRVAEIAHKRGVGNVRVALAWMLSKPYVTAPIVGASKLEQFDDLAKATELKLDPEEIKALEEPYTPHPILGHA